MDQVLKALLASWPLWLLLLVLLALTAVLKQLGFIKVRTNRRERRGGATAQEANAIEETDEGPSGPVTFPYRARRSLLTPAEQAFHRTLLQAVNGRSAVFVQVNLASLIDAVSRDRSEQQAAYNRICHKHVDFVLCDMAAGARPILVIELDDASHEKATRRLRDQFIDKALAAAGLPILHVPAAASYDPAKLESAIRDALNPAPKAPPPPSNAKEDLARLRASRPR